MGLFDFLKKKEEPKVNAKVDIDGQEVISFGDQVSPVPIEHSNVIEGEHDIFSKTMSEESQVDVEKEEIEDIVPVPDEDFPTVEETSKDINISPNDMAIFKACLLAEVKRKKGTGELKEEDVRSFCAERMINFSKGLFQYPEDVRKSMRRYLENQDIINELTGKPKVLQPEDDIIKKVA